MKLPKYVPGQLFLIETFGEMISCYQIIDVGADQNTLEYKYKCGLTMGDNFWMYSEDEITRSALAFDKNGIWITNDL